MDSQVDEIKEKLNIVDIVQEYVPSLKRSGRNFFGLCPFHQEKSPSFSVNPELNIFKCFGCGEGGDVLTFLQKIEGVDFPKAMELAAKRAGVTLKKFDSPQARKFREKKQRALDAHILASEYYHFLLTEHKTGRVGLSYATKARKIEMDQIKKFKLGYAPKNFNNLRNFLTKKGFKDSDLVEFGLLARKGANIYDKFRGRLMHPIFSMQGDVVGFSGRIIDKEDKGPKYLNSPETVIYKKKNLVYGGYQAKDAMRKTGFVVLVEGNIDIVSSHRAGVENIVCPLGTALTDDQLKLLKRYVEEIYFAFDTDLAGKKALLRSLEMVERQGFTAKAIDLGDFGDSDDLICSEDGVKLWKKRVKSAVEIPEFIIEKFKDDYNLSNASQKQKYIKSCLPFIAKLRDEIRVSDFLNSLSITTGVDVEQLRKYLQRYRNSHRKNNNAFKAPDNNQTDSQSGQLNQDSQYSQQTNQKKQANKNFSKTFINIISLIHFYGDKIKNTEALTNLYKQVVEEIDEEFETEFRLLEFSLTDKKDEALGETVKEIIKNDASMSLNLKNESSVDQVLETMLANWLLKTINAYLKELNRQAQEIVLFSEDSRDEEYSEEHLERLNYLTEKINKLSLLKGKFGNR
jgi:DNA primase